MRKLNIFFITCLIFFMSHTQIIYSVSDEEVALLQESAKDSGIVDEIMSEIKKIQVPEEITDFINNVSLEEGDTFEVPGLEDAIGINGNVLIYDEKVPAEGIKADEGTSLTLWLPKTWKISHTFPTFKNLDDTPIEKPAFVLSTFEYFDERQGVMIKEGLNIISKVKLANLDVPKTLKSVRDNVAKKVSVLMLHGVVPKKVKDTYFEATAKMKKGKNVKLSEFLPLDKLGLPSSMKKKFENVQLLSPSFVVHFDRFGREFGMDGKVEMFGAKLDATLRSVKEKEEKGQARFKLELPSTWKLSDSFDELKSMDALTPENASFIVSNYKYDDSSLGIAVEPGLNINGTINITDIKTDAPIGKVAKKLGKVADKLIFSGVIKKKVKQSIFKAYIPTAEVEELPLSKLMPINKLPLPDEYKKTIGNYKLIKPRISIDLTPGTKLVEIDSGMIFKFGYVRANILFRKLHGNKSVGVLIINMPLGWKISDDFSLFKPFDKLTTSNPKIVISTEDYNEEKLKAALKEGLNLVAEIDLSGPLSVVKTFMKKALAEKGVSYEGEKFILVGSIAKNIRKSNFEVIIPGEITFDYQKMYKEGEIKKKPEKILWTKTGNFILSIAPNLELGISSGMKVQYVKQKNPVYFKGAVEVSPSTFTLSGSMDGMLKHAFGVSWLDLADLGMEFDVDYKFLAATGMPAGLGLRGIVDIGKKKKTRIDIAGKIEVNTLGLGELVFSGKTKHLDLTQLIELLSKMANKNISPSKVPNLTFSDVDLTVVPTPAEIAGKHYDSGVLVKGGVKLGGITGGIAIELNAADKKMSGSGFLKNIDKKVFKLTGAGLDKKYGTRDDGPMVSIAISPTEQRVFISGKVEIPPLKLMQNTEVDLTATGGSFNITAKLLGKFDLGVHVDFDLKSPEEFEAKLSFSNDLLTYLEKELLSKLDAFEKKSKEDLKVVNANKLTGKAKKEIEELTQEIDELKKKIEKKDAECEEVDGWKDPKDKLKCRTKWVGLKAKRTSLQAKRTSIDIGEGITTGVTTAVREVAKGGVSVVAKMGEWTAKGLGGLLNIKHISGETSGLELMTGSSPKVSVDITFFGKDILIKDLQFDSNDVFGLIDNLFEKLIDSLDGNDSSSNSSMNND